MKMSSILIFTFLVFRASCWAAISIYHMCIGSPRFSSLSDLTNLSVYYHYHVSTRISRCFSSRSANELLLDICFSLFNNPLFIFLAKFIASQFIDFYRKEAILVFLSAIQIFRLDLADFVWFELSEHMTLLQTKILPFSLPTHAIHEPGLITPSISRFQAKVSQPRTCVQ